MFANEVGVGSSAVTAAVGEVSHPVKQGLSNAVSVFIGTFFVCTTSAIMMLMTGCYNVSDGADGLLYEDFRVWHTEMTSYLPPLIR